MKTIHLYCSAAIIVALTFIFANIHIPKTQTSHVEAAQSSKKVEMSNVSSQAQKPEQVASLAVIPAVETKPQAPSPEPVAELTDHQKLMQEAGIASDYWPYVEDILMKESGWCPTKWEGEHECLSYHGVPDGIGYGLCQATPGFKMASQDPDWATNPVKQLQWCDNYAQQYGGWPQAKSFRDCLGSCYSPRTNTTVYKRTTWF